MSLRLLAVADSESFLKWAVTTLEHIGSSWPGAEARTVIIKGPLEPSPEQTAAALDGTAATTCPVVSRRELARLVRQYRPDVVLVAATGPVSELIALTVLRAQPSPRPVLLTGPPGIAMTPAATKGTVWRYRWCDGYIVHSPPEGELFAEAFARHGARPRILLSRLPFLAPRPLGQPAPVHRVVFAPQSVVPHAREDRVRILGALADLSNEGFEVVVKVRTRAGERQTHHEALPFDTLWAQEHARLGAPLEALRFESGSMHAWLTPGSALVTVSSTAALESMALGLPTALVSDFGVSPDLGNAVYDGSGCLVRLDELATSLRSGGPLPSAAWLEGSYLHSDTHSLTAALRELLAARDAGTLPEPDRRSVSPLIRAYSVIKSDFPVVWFPAMYARSLLGRLRPLH